MENADFKGLKEVKDVKVPVLGKGPTAWQKRRVRLEAKGLATSTRRAIGRHSARVPEVVRADLRTSADAVDKAIAGGDHDAIAEALVKLEHLVDEHLSFTKKSTFREYADSIGVAVLVALTLRAFVVEAFKIPSGSMIPTM